MLLGLSAGTSLAVRTRAYLAKNPRRCRGFS